MSIRKATINDLKSLQSLNQELGEYNASIDKFAQADWGKTEEARQHYEHAIEDPDALCIVSEENGNLAGYLTGELLPDAASRPGKRAELVNMVVLENHRNQGIGPKLIEEFLNWSRGKGADRIMVNVYAVNEGAIKLYERYGFKPLDLIMEKVVEAKK